ncbi:MAG: nitrophenyl compound nitroreductase subunit ArsF family protein [Thermoguttaceae bacterium]
MKNYCLLCVLCFIIYGTISFAEECCPVDYKTKPPYDWTQEQLNKELNINQQVDSEGKPIITKQPKDYITVIYFHRSPGCQTCQLMSKYVFETLKEKFTKPLQNKTVVLAYLNFEEAKNEKIVKRLKIGSPTMVVLQTVNEKDVKAKRCDKIWELAGDKKAFFQFVENEVADYVKNLNENVQ